MSSSYEKSVKGGTKIKLAAPKSKYVEHILQATRAGEAGVAEIFRTMTHRLRDSTWTIVFKALIITHLMIREGEPNITLRYLTESPSKLAISNFSAVQVQGENIRHYYNYLIQRVKAYKDTQTDWVKDGKGRLKKQTIDKGLLRETEVVQKQIYAVLKCELFVQEAENEITLTAFRLLTMDLLSLFHVSNEAAINVLEHFFEMSRPDAERALAIYKTFSKQTSQVVEFLRVAARYENSTRLQIPSLKHAPIDLAGALEEYLNDPDFEINRRQYLAQIEAKKGGKVPSTTNDAVSDFSKLNINGASSQALSGTAKPSQAVTAQKPEARGPAPDLIDLFASIGQNQQPMGSQPQPQFTNAQSMPQYQFQPQPFQSSQGQAPQMANQSFSSTNPFASMISQPQQPQASTQPNFIGFGGQPHAQNTPFSPNQAISPSQSTSFQQQPFVSGQPGPFANGMQQQSQQQPFMNGSQSLSQGQGQSFNTPFATGGLQPTTTGQQTTNPQSLSQGQGQPFNTPFATGGLQPTTTGQQTTNPFRQSMMAQSTASTTQSFPNASPFSPQQGQQATNPFRSFSPQTTANSNSPFSPSAPVSSAASFFSTQSLLSPQSVQSMPAAQPLQPARTGTNPFKSAPPSTFHTPITSPLTPQRTGTNPFRQSAWANPQTGPG